MKVWVVTRGSYSDYQIEGIFSSKEKARHFVNELHGGDEIEEWDVDEKVGYEIVIGYRAKIRLSTGEITVLDPEEFLAKDHARSDLVEDWYDDVKMATSYVSQEHANKLAVEARRDWLRKGHPPAGSCSSCGLDVADRHDPVRACEKLLCFTCLKEIAENSHG